MSDDNDDINDIKIIVAGNCFTGKTSFVNKWSKNIFIETYKQTVIPEFAFKVFEKDSILYRIQLWDICGKDNSSSVIHIFAKDSDGCIIMSDATNKQTREE